MYNSIEKIEKNFQPFVYPVCFLKMFTFGHAEFKDN